MARALESGACIDEFTSVVDREVAKACAFAAARYIRARGLQRITFASCHYDIVDWLQPDWVFDTKGGVMLPRGSLPARVLYVEPCAVDLWPIFRAHHYLSGDINRSARCWRAMWNDTLIGFASALAFPNGNFRNAWREHRTVILPDYQGLGFGVRLSDAIGFIFRAEDCRYFSKTVHPRMGEYRNASPLWRPTSKNMKARPDYAAMRVTKEAAYKHRHIARVAYSHEFIGGLCSK
jgi:GNAT superfamily N-acetyltransferase